NQFERGLDCFRESVSIRRRIGDWNNLPFALCVLAWNLIDFGFFQEGETYLDEALRIMDETGITPMFAICRTLKANLAFWGGEFDIARRSIEIAMKVAGKQSYLTSVELAQAVSSNLLSLARNYQQARVLCDQSQSHMLSPMFARQTEW